VLETLGIFIHALYYL